MQLIAESEGALDVVARDIIKYAGDERIWIFYGEMGAGKTTLIKAIAHQLNIEDNVHSPTFSIVNEYGDALGETFYHFDFYRIEKETEAMDIGIDEYFESGSLCLIEWPQKIPSLLPDAYLQIDIKILSNTSREIKLSHHGK